MTTIVQSRKEWDLSAYSTYLAVLVLLCNFDSPVACSEAAFKNSPRPGDRWKKEAIFEYYGEYDMHHLQAFNFVL